jgi:leucine dehydrogenase
MAVIAERTNHVTGLPERLGGSGDPSPITARGVEAAIRACCERRYGSPDPAGRRITVIGLGHVGASLAERLAAAGAELAVCDIDEGKRELAARLGARWIEPARALTVPCEVLAPCALGGAIDERSITELDCEVICGSANNVLASDGLAEQLDAREILYAPDFIANAGGLINVYRELRGYSAERARELALGIEPAMTAILSAARERDVTPLVAAGEVARERLEGAIAHTGAREPAMRN